MTLGVAPRSAIATLAALIALLLGLSLVETAPAKVKTFSPAAKTRKALVFKFRGLEPRTVRAAKVLLRHRGGKLRRKKLSTRRVRRVARRGKLRVRRKGRMGRRARTSRARPTKPDKAKGGRVKVIVEEPLDGGTTDGGSTDGGTTDGGSTDTNALAVPSSVPEGCSSDATTAILSWIDSVPDGSSLRFEAGACYRIEGTLEIKNRDLAIDGAGSTFKSLNAPTSHRSIWRAHDSTLQLRNMALVGSYAKGGTHNADLQWAHGVDLRGTDAVIEDVHMSDLAGDCVYFGLGADRSTGAFRDGSCRRIGRNGVSVVAGEDIRVERVTTDKIGYIAFDVEPNSGPGNGSQRVVFDSNTIGSYHLKAYTVIGNAPVSDQAFTNNRVIGQGLRIGVIDKSHRPQQLNISGNSSDTATGHNALNLQGVDGVTIKSNTVPLTEGTMAQVSYYCGASVSGNSYPGGSKEVNFVQKSC